MKRRFFTLACSFFAALTMPLVANFELQDYDPESKLTGEFGIFVDRYVSLEATMLVEEFGHFHPDLKVKLETSMAGGSIGDGPRTIKSPLYFMGRKIADRELEKLGTKQHLTVPAFGWGVFLAVSEKSTIKSIDLNSVGDAFFGQRTKEIIWSEIGAEGGANNSDEVVLHGMSDLSRFTLLFRTLLPTDQKLAPLVTRHRGVKDLLQTVERSEGGALGFCGRGSKEVRLLALRKEHGDTAIPPPRGRISLEAEHSYPLMSIAMVYSSNVSKDSAHAEFCKFLTSKAGLRAMKKLEFVIPFSDEDYGNISRDLGIQLEGG